jgi:hypothetical protein
LSSLLFGPEHPGLREGIMVQLRIFLAEFDLANTKNDVSIFYLRVLSTAWLFAGFEQRVQKAI